MQAPPAAASLRLGRASASGQHLTGQDHDHDGADDRDPSFGQAGAAGDPPIEFAEENGGVGGASGGLAEVSAQPTVALGLLAAAGAGPDWRARGHNPVPRHRVGGGPESAHVQACLRDDRAGQPPPKQLIR
jgi:hypothetical protein